MTPRESIDNVRAGDTVYWVDVNGKGEIFSGVVSKAGSKLITVVNGWRGIVFRKDTLKTNDEYRHQTLILDLKAYEEEQTKENIIYSILRASSYELKKCSLADIEAAAKLLGLKG